MPEVETVRRQLVSAATGLRFVSVGAAQTSMLRDCSEGRLRAELPGRVIEDVNRLGKFLLLRLSGAGEWYLTIHLGMTGQILLTADQLPASPHVRFEFILERSEGGRAVLQFRDMRKFGRLHLTAGGAAPRLAALGPDAWIGGWDATYLGARLKGRRAPLKAFLLDQRNLAGIGNIYADETLWWSRLAPTRACRDLDDDEIDRLAVEIRRQLEEGVKRLGCTLADFVDIEGRPGTFQERLQAYGRHGEECSRCGVNLVRIVVAGRGTTYCPGCQR